MSFFGKYYFTSSHASGALRRDDVDAMLHSRQKPGSTGREPFRPPADVYESDKGYVVLVELAGVRTEDMEIHVSESELIVQGKRREACAHCKKSYLQMEIEYGPFERHILLPAPVDGKNAIARFADGMLEVFLPLARTAPREQDVVIVVRHDIVQNL